MYLGRYQLGKWIDVYLQVRNATHSPLLPDAVPTIKFYGPTGLISTGKMPIADKVVTPGLFCTRLLLSNPFTTGPQSVEMRYVVAGSSRLEVRSFEIIEGGNSLGQSIGMHYLHQPHADFILFQVESGRILRGKNPRVNN